MKNKELLSSIRGLQKLDIPEDGRLGLLIAVLMDFVGEYEIAREIHDIYRKAYDAK